MGVNETVTRPYIFKNKLHCVTYVFTTLCNQSLEKFKEGECLYSALL